MASCCLSLDETKGMGKKSVIICICMFAFARTARTQQIQLIKDLNPGMAGTNITGYFPFKGAFLFTETGTDYARLWGSYGTPLTTKLIKEFRNAAGTDIYGLILFHDKVYFVANDSLHGYELWKSDGTPDGTTIVKDINPGIGSGFHTWNTPYVFK